MRTYMHYHIKCMKAYLQMRMRAKTGEFLKILNRAHPDADAVASRNYVVRDSDVSSNQILGPSARLVVGLSLICSDIHASIDK